MNVPAGQGVHAALVVLVQLAPQDVPAAQVVQALHAVAKLLDWKVPAAHSVHVDTSDPVLNEPARQLRHSRSAQARQPSPWYRPARHVWHVWHAVPLLAAWNVPAAHPSHAKRPVALTNVPT